MDESQEQKKIRIMIACNTLTSIHQGAYTDHARFYYRLGKDFPDMEFAQFFARRMSIDMFRNKAARLAIDTKCQYLMFIDDDMQFDYKIFSQLYKEMENWDVLAALNYIRGYPFDPMAFRYNPNKQNNLICIEDKTIEEAEGKPIYVDAIGTAFCIINVDCLKKVGAPWFVTGPENTEDIFFCIKAEKKYKELGEKVRIGVHTGAITGHILDPEVISYHTKKYLVKFYEGYMSEEQIEMVKKKDRGIGYVKQIEAMVDSVNENS